MLSPELLDVGIRMCDIMQRRTNTKKDDAVSPVVGVMLMLVVTIIIAAVVSQFAGGLITTQKATPSASIKTTIDADDLSFSMKVLSVSEPIDTANLKLVTTMAKNGVLYTGTVVPSASKTYYDAGPFGLGMKINGTGFTVGYDEATDSGGESSSKYAWSQENIGQWFGNYSLYNGVSMSAQGEYELGYILGSGGQVDGDAVVNGVSTSEVTTEQLTPYGTVNDQDTPSGIKVTIGGETKFFYPSDGYRATRSSGKIYVYKVDDRKTVDILKSGDTVNVRLIYTPSGQQIYSEDVKVR
ncbi:type IV pilin N-terminal domain-containing protein [Methanorbis furvi]